MTAEEFFDGIEPKRLPSSLKASAMLCGTVSASPSVATNGFAKLVSATSLRNAFNQ
jgi:hypothetical protein